MTNARSTQFQPHATENVRGTTVAYAQYRTDLELKFYMRALQQNNNQNLVVVLGLGEDVDLPASELPANTRVIQTTATKRDEKTVAGWFEENPLRAVIVAMTGLKPHEGLLMLFPADWKGVAPELLVEHARRWRYTPHSSEDEIQL